MRRLPILIGFLALPLSAAAAETNLYELFRTQANEEFTVQGEIDAPVIQFLQGVYSGRWGLREEEIVAAIKGRPWLACAVEGDIAQGTSSDVRNIIECGRALENIQLLADEEQRLRTFGRTLQRMSTAQELPLSEIPGRPFHMATDLSGIINIWRAGTGSVQQAITGSMLVRTRALTEEEAETIKVEFDGIAQALAGREGGQNEEWYTGLVWYFQYGARLRVGDRNPAYPPPLEDDQSGDGTERQYLFREDFKNTWGEALKQIWNKLPKDRDDFDPPLSANEAAYILFPDELQDVLPENLLVWARVDQAPESGGSQNQHPLGDVGLAWKYPLEPLLPALLSSKNEESGRPILGGKYPPEPAMPASSDENGNPLPEGSTVPTDGRGLCSMALAQRGYLCRPISVASEEQCPASDTEDDEENVITLVSCTLDEEPTLTVAGPDACREIEWKNGEEPQRCDVQLEEGCPDGQSGITFPKEGNGTIRVCIDGEAAGSTLTYLLEHELVHAQQACSMPPGNPFEALATEEEQNALCCRLEGEAHLVSCKRMYEDGLLRGEDGGPLFINGVEITPQTCMEVARASSCDYIVGRDARCTMSTILTSADAGAMKAAALAANNPADLPDTYEEATEPETMDPRVAARIRTIERQIPVCMPGTESDYKNTIGNNACYIGQCVEETLELHRVTGGRSPISVGDGAFPWDEPDMGEALATVLRSVPATSPPLPSYRPQLVTKILEDALCQLQGLPASTPPHLCSFSPSRRLAVPLEDGAATARSLLLNSEEQRDATLLTEKLAAGLGSRIGTDMQGQYLRIGTRSLSEVVALANLLLKEAITVTFPAKMCPLSLD